MPTARRQSCSPQHERHGSRSLPSERWLATDTGGRSSIKSQIGFEWGNVTPHKHFTLLSWAVTFSARAVREWAQRHKVCTIVTAHTPVSPGRTAFEKLVAELAGDDISLVQVRRAWESAAWPEARRGFFAFREKTAALIA